MVRKTPEGGFRHGESGYVNYGCRCDVCKRANADKTNRLRNRNSEERVEVNGRMVHPLAPHGTVNGYMYYRCRCEPCTQAAGERNK